MPDGAKVRRSPLLAVCVFGVLGAGCRDILGFQAPNGLDVGGDGNVGGNGSISSGGGAGGTTGSSGNSMVVTGGGTNGEGGSGGNDSGDGGTSGDGNAGGEGGTSGAESAGGDGGTSGGGNAGSENGGAGGGACASGSYDNDGNPNTACATWATCSVGQRVLSDGTDSTNRTCAACTGETFSTTENADRCSPWATCEIGTHVSMGGTARTNRTCAPCEGDQVTVQQNQAECLDPDDCEPGTVEVAPGSCEECPQGTYCAGGDAARVECGTTSYDGDRDPGTECLDFAECTWELGGVAEAGTPLENVMCAAVPSEFRQFGTDGVDAIQAVAADAAGRVFVAGRVDVATEPPANYDGFIRAYDANGTLLPFDVRLSSPGEENVRSLHVDVSGDLYVAGFTTGTLDGTANSGGRDGFVAKYGANGVQEWIRQVRTSANDVLNAVTTDSAGVVYAVGSTNGVLGSGNAGGADAFVISFDIERSITRTFQFGTAQNDALTAIALNLAEDRINVAGTTQELLAPGGTYVDGIDAHFEQFAIDESFTALAFLQFGSTGDDEPMGITVDEDDNVYVVGGTDGELPDNDLIGATDAFVAKYDGDGEPQWVRQFGTTSSEFAKSAVVLDGDVYFAGAAYSALRDYDAYVQEISADGTLGAAQYFGTEEYDEGNGIAVDASGNLFVAGRTDGAVVGTNAGGSDAFVVRIPPE